MNNILTKEVSPKFVRIARLGILGVGIATLALLIATIANNKYTEARNKKQVEAAFSKVVFPSSIKPSENKWTRVGFGEPLYWMYTYYSQESIGTVGKVIQTSLQNAGYTIISYGDCAETNATSCGGRAYNTSDDVNIVFRIAALPDTAISKETRPKADNSSATRISMEIEKYHE